MRERFARAGGLEERQVFHAETELFIFPDAGQARMRRRTTWFDRHGLVQGQEDTEWVGPVTALLGNGPGVEPDTTVVRAEPGTTVAQVESDTTAAQVESEAVTARAGFSDRVADFLMLAAVLLALVVTLRFVVPR